MLAPSELAFILDKNFIRANWSGREERFGIINETRIGMVKHPSGGQKRRSK